MSCGKVTFCFMKVAVKDHGVEHVASSTGEGYEGMIATFALGNFAVVVGSRDWVPILTTPAAQ